MCYSIEKQRKETHLTIKEIRTMKFVIEKVANMVFITSDCGTVFNAWDEHEFTERKLTNAMNRILKNTNGNATFTRTF